MIQLTLLFTSEVNFNFKKIVSYFKMHIYYVKEYGVIFGKWEFPNIRQNPGVHGVYSQFGYLSHLHIKKAELSQEMVNEFLSMGILGMPRKWDDYFKLKRLEHFCWRAAI